MLIKTSNDCCDKYDETAALVFSTLRCLTHFLSFSLTFSFFLFGAAIAITFSLHQEMFSIFLLLIELLLFVLEEILL